jgi:hypothetical protein
MYDFSWRSCWSLSANRVGRGRARCFVRVAGFPANATLERQSRAWFAERLEPSHILIDDPGASAVWRGTRVKY